MYAAVCLMCEQGDLKHAEIADRVERKRECASSSNISTSNHLAGRAAYDPGPDRTCPSRSGPQPAEQAIFPQTAS